jgi:hypothetical protein
MNASTGEGVSAVPLRRSRPRGSPRYRAGSSSSTTTAARTAREAACCTTSRAVKTNPSWTTARKSRNTGMNTSRNST